jgi:hypothetical protein
MHHASQVAHTMSIEVITRDDLLPGTPARCSKHAMGMTQTIKFRAHALSEAGSDAAWRKRASATKGRGVRLSEQRVKRYEGVWMDPDGGALTGSVSST